MHHNLIRKSKKENNDMYLLSALLLSTLIGSLPPIPILLQYLSVLSHFIGDAISSMTTSSIRVGPLMTSNNQPSISLENNDWLSYLKLILVEKPNFGDNFYQFYLKYNLVFLQKFSSSFLINLLF